MPTYPLTIPSTIKFTTSTWISRDVTAESTSPFTGDSQIIVWPAQWWECTLTMIPMTPEAAQGAAAWLRSLRGKSGTFYLGDRTRPVPTGSAATVPGTPLVMGGSQVGDEIIIDGLPVSTTGYLKAGDLIQIGSWLYECSEDVNTNGSGEATIPIWPDLRVSPANNDPVIVTDCQGIFCRMSDVVQSPYKDKLIQLSFDVKEALRG